MVSIAPSAPILRSVQRRTMRTLVVAQVLGAVGLAAGGTAGALLAQDLTGDTAAAGLPLALLVLGSGVGAVVVTRIMNLAGRRAGLTTAHLCGALGAVLSVAAAGLRDWPLLLGGCALLGCGNAAVMLARYAAADLAVRRGRSISTVVTAASVGAVAGPNLLGPAGAVARRLGLPDGTGLFLLAIPAFLAAALVLIVFLRPDPLVLAREAVLAGSPVSGRPITAMFANADVRLALLVLATSNLTMVAIMAVAPVQMHVHGAGLGMVGLTISAHIAAMYLPSPITGALADRLGARRVTSAAALVLVAAGTVALVAGSGLVGTVIVLILLGIGWNAGLIGGSALLREAPIEPSQQTWAEGLGELGMGAAAAVGGGSAGVVLGAGGFAVLCLVAAVPCVLLLAVIATNSTVEGET